MKRLLLLLRLPLAIELANVIIHRLVRAESQGTHWIDDVSLAITAAVVLYVGWTVARTLDRVGLAILGALLVWGCSVTAVTVLMGAKLVLQDLASSETGLLAVKGFLFSALLIVPVVALLSGIAGFVAVRTRRSGA